MSGDFYAWLKEVRCTTVREAAARFSAAYSSVRERLNRLARCGVLEKKMVGRVAVYCLKEMPPRKNIKKTRKKKTSMKIVQRAERVAELLGAEGCMSSSALRRALGIGYSPLRYVLTLLMSQGRAVEVVVGRTAIWCRDRRTAEELVARLREAAHRLASRRRYIKPSELLQMVRRDKEAYELFTRFVPLSRFAGDRIHPVAMAFADSILASLYGDPIRYAHRRHVYFVSPQPRQDLGDIAIRDGASHVVTVSLPPDLAAALEDARRRGASVKELVVRAIEQLLARFR